MHPSPRQRPRRRRPARWSRRGRDSPFHSAQASVDRIWVLPPLAEPGPVLVEDGAGKGPACPLASHHSVWTDTFSSVQRNLELLTEVCGFSAVTSSLHGNP